MGNRPRGSDRPLHAHPALVWAGIAVAAGFTYLAIRDVRPGAVWDALTASDPTFVVPALAVLAVAVWLRALRWRWLFAAERRPAAGTVVRALLVGYLFNNILPFRAGEAARVLVLHARAGTSRAEAAATVIVERVFDLITLLALLFLALPLFPPVAWVRGAAVLAGALAIAALALVVALALYDERVAALLLRPFRRVLGPVRTAGVATSATTGLASLRDWRIAAVATGVTALSWLVLALSFWILALGFDLGVPPSAALLVVIATNLVQVIPSTPGAFGVFEGATVIALGAYGVAPAPALSYALVLHALNFVPVVLVGWIAWRGGSRVASSVAGASR